MTQLVSSWVIVLFREGSEGSKALLCEHQKFTARLVSEIAIVDETVECCLVLGGADAVVAVEADLQLDYISSNFASARSAGTVADIVEDRFVNFGRTKGYCHIDFSLLLCWKKSQSSLQRRIRVNGAWGGPDFGT